MRLKLFLSLLLIGTSIMAHAQSGSIRGIVFDGETGEYLPGVTVFLEGTTSGTITDLDGKFNLNVEEGTYSLRISFISYDPLQITDVEVIPGEVTSLGEIKLEEGERQVFAKPIPDFMMEIVQAGGLVTLIKEKGTF